MLIYKFGGSSIANPGLMKRVAELVNDHNKKIVVLSAVAGTTDRLITIGELLFSQQKGKAANKIRTLKDEYHHFCSKLFTQARYLEYGHQLVDSCFTYLHNFTLDVFTSFKERALLAEGEILSSGLFSLYLEEMGVSSSLLPALEFMRIDENAEPQLDHIKKNLKVQIEKKPHTKLFITQGYICRNIFGEIDNLKRGGSDYTASLIGAAVDADEILIWTDVSGMRNNDPRVVNNTRVVNQLSYDEAAELAYFGAKILHPSSVLPAQKKQIPVRLKNTLQPKETGTLISGKHSKGEVKAVVAKDGIIAIKIKSARMLLAYGFLRKVFEIFELYKTPIDMITTSEVAVSITIDNEIYLKEIINDLQQYGDVEVDREQTIICIVGDFLADKKGYASLIFEALADVPLRMISYGGSKHNISILVSGKHKEQALNSLNEKVFLCYRE